MRKGCDGEKKKNILFRGVVCCSGGLYGCSGGLYTVQGGYLLFRGVICCSGVLYAVQEGYIMKKIMIILVAKNIVASPPPERPPTGMLTACAKRKREHIKPKDERKIENLADNGRKRRERTPQKSKETQQKKDKLGLNWASSAPTGTGFYFN